MLSNWKNRRVKALGFNDLPYAPFIIVILGLLTPVIFFGAKPLQYPWEYCVNFTVSLVMCTIYYFTTVGLTVILRLQYSRSEETGTRIVRQLQFTALNIIIVQSAVSVFFTYFKFDKGGHIPPTLLQVLLASIFLVIMVSSIFESIFLFKKYREAELEREKLARINLQSQLETLKNQVNPHFLFNSLNTLIGVIPEDQDLAVEFVQKLSTSYRNILTFRNERLISLAQELQALESYIFLLKMRFQDKICVNKKIELDLNEHLIIPLSLQMLIENAVKHNIVSAKKPLHISIKSDGHYLIISNNKQIKVQDHNSTKVGLSNIKERYRLINHTEVSVRETEDVFEVKLPLIKVKQA